jgi:hypothetical protein
MSQTMIIPQPVLDVYNTHYNNQTYRAFSVALAAALGLDERVTQLEAYDERHNRIMNLLIDASLELVGSEYHAGAGQRLGEALGELNDHAPRLVRLAVEHLNHFVTDKRPWEIVLREDPDSDYLVEKIGKGIEMLGMGLGEIVHYSHPHPAIRQFHERLTTQDKEGRHD